MPIHYKRLGQNIRAARRYADLTQKAIAERLAIKSPEHICHIERGRRHVQLEMLDALCETLNISYEEMLQGATDAHIRKAGNGLPKGYGEQFEEIVADCPEEVVKGMLEMCRQALHIYNLRK